MIDLTEYKNKKDGDVLKADDWNDLLTKIEEGSNTGTSVTDVCVDGTSVVTDGVASISLEELTKKIQDLSTELEDLKSKPTSASHFYVNGDLTAPVDGVVTLEAGGEYTLSGTLNGRIEIVDSDGTGDWTFLRLNGVTITSEEDTAIKYSPADKGLEIYICPDTINQLVCHKVAASNESDQPGAIHSENNLRLYGYGYLILVNPGGHGIKASKILAGGVNGIYIDAIHDGIHAGSRLDLLGTNAFDFAACHDAFGLGDADSNGEQKVINYLPYRDCILIEKLTGFVFNCKEEGKIVTYDSINTLKANLQRLSPCIQDSKFIQAKTQLGVGDSNFPETYKLPDVDSGYKISIHAEDENDNVLTATSTTKQIVDNCWEPTVTDTNIIIDAEGVTITGTVYKYVIDVEGYISGKYLETSLVRSDFNLRNVYINSTDTTNAAIKYTIDEKRVKICAKSGLNFIISANSTINDNGKGMGAISSENNISFEIKSGAVLFVGGVYGACGSRILIQDTSGALFLNASNLDLLGTEIYLGSDEDTPHPFDGYLQLTNGIGTRLNSKGEKGTFTLRAPMHGTIYPLIVSSANTCTFEKGTAAYLGSPYDVVSAENGFVTDNDADLPIANATLPYAVCRYNKVPLMELASERPAAEK